MWWRTRPSQSGAVDLPRSPHRWAVVDVETSGLYPGTHRVLSVAAFALDHRGRREHEVVSLVDPGCDPGPVHVHGLTRTRLAGAPPFAAVVPQLIEVLSGRVLVAHNASFDYGFLAAEARRAKVALPTRQRLCTLTLSRRLGVPVPDFRLETLAAHWGVPHRAAHDAVDDATALRAVLAHSLRLADQLRMPLPLVDCRGYDGALHPSSIAKVPCPWRNPGRLLPGAPLVQGMKVVITGETRLPREELADRLQAAGLEVLNSVSRLTSVLVSNTRRPNSVKGMRAQAEGTLLIDEAALLRLLAAVEPGQPKGGPEVKHTPSGPSVVVPRQPPGPLAQRRVLVLGGAHKHAASLRAALAERGASAAVNLSANVTDIVLLAGGERDNRVPRALAAGLAVHPGPTVFGIPLPGPPADVSALPSRTTFQPVESSVEELPQRGPEPRVLPRGGVVDLPPAPVWTVNVAWRAVAVTGGAELDVVALLLSDDDRVVTDEDFVFYNAPVSEDGAVQLAVDGDSEQSIRIDLERLPEHCSRVLVAGALSAGCHFGDLGAVTLSVDGPRGPAVTATLDAAETEQTMLLGQVYRRGDVWRFRAIGQGFSNGLADLAQRYGVVVD